MGRGGGGVGERCMDGERWGGEGGEEYGWSLVGW